MEVGRRAPRPRVVSAAPLGFTILELTVVIAFIGILAAMLFPVFARAREQARSAQCANNLWQIGMALQMYAEDWGGRYPPQEDNLAPIAWRVGNDATFRCPSARFSGLTRLELERLAKARHKEYLNLGRQARMSPSYVEQWTAWTPWVVIADGVLLGSDYYYHAGLTNEASGSAVLAAEREASHLDGAHVLYASGQVKLLPAAEWRKLIPTSAQRREQDFPSEQEGFGAGPGRGGRSPMGARGRAGLGTTGGRSVTGGRR
jgi:type II secretory pathway pseudopilin PulG